MIICKEEIEYVVIPSGLFNNLQSRSDVNFISDLACSWSCCRASETTFVDQLVFGKLKSHVIIVVGKVVL